MDWGSVADWVSGVGSISASVVALYLAGSERRASRERERPEISTSISLPGESGWGVVSMNVTNPARKEWQLLRAEILQPEIGRLLRERGAMVPGTKPFEEVFSTERRDECASRSLDLGRTIYSCDAIAGGSTGSGPANSIHERLLVFVGQDPRRMVVRLHFTSLEPRPDRFHKDVVRTFR
jgi:hypothetical protein